MSCWVVPSLAAELWGISVEQVWQRVHQGLVPVKQELGFMVVDVAPHSPIIGHAVSRPHPPTFTPKEQAATETKQPLRLKAA